MSGYIMNLDSEEKLELYINNGVYGTIIKRPKGNYWSPAIEYTLADYLTMRPNDLIFFFLERKIYGIGRIIGFEIDDHKIATFCNYPGSSLPKANSPEEPETFLWKEDGEEDVRWIVFFEHYPYFFREGLDMDEVLESDVKHVVRALRVFERRSFIQMDNEETQVILDLFLRQNQGILNQRAPIPEKVFPDNSRSLHDATKNRGSHLRLHLTDIDSLIENYVEGSQVTHEALLQAWIVDYLTHNYPRVTDIFGNWDFICNQAPASPQKPVMYMDRIDIFGYVRTRNRPYP